MTNRREFLKQICYGAAVSSLPLSFLSCSKLKNKPNVILIITDDQGYGDFGINGNPIIKTPNLDDMAKRSAQMTNYYVCPVCAPTRACLMTGRYNYRTRVIDTWVGRAMMEPTEVTLAEILKKSGYATGLFGKWHLGDNYPMRPQDQGFDEVLMHRGGGIGQPADPIGGEGKYTDPVLFHNGKETSRKGYCTDIYFDDALNWIQKKVNKNQNFFAYLPTNTPHSPYHDVPKELYEMYKKMNLNSDQFPQEKGFTLPEKTDTDKLARIYAMITNIDDNIGKLYKKLTALNQLENTFVLFMVDNGPNTRRYTAGMNGKKTEVYEGGIHSPLFAYWQGKLMPGHSNDRVVAHIDILPTVLDACGVSLPQNVELDGRSFLTLLKNQKTNWEDRNIVIQAHRGDLPVRYHNFMIRNQKWKLLHNSGFGIKNFEGQPRFELYDMDNDPLEMKNVLNDFPDIFKKLKEAYNDWFDDVGNTRPNNYEPPRIHIGTRYENPVVLTHQDWRHIKGKTWAENSNGYWKLHVAESGNYAFKVHLKGNRESGEAELKVDDLLIKTKFAKNQSELLFKNVVLQKGDVDLLVTLTINKNTKGPWQVEVKKMTN